jgi:hypothetical protein
LNFNKVAHPESNENHTLSRFSNVDICCNRVKFSLTSPNIVCDDK